MRRAPPIELSSEELTALQRIARSSLSSVRDVLRARIVLLGAEGLENFDIAGKPGAGPDTVSKWRRRFAQHRLAGLLDRPGRGRKPHYGRELVERIVGDTVHRTPEQATHWSTRTMAKHAGVSHTTVQRIWHAHELKPHLVRTFKLSNDKHFVEKLRDVIGLYLNPPEHALVFCVDEKSQTQAPRPLPTRATDEKGTRRCDVTRLQAPRHHHVARRSQCPGGHCHWQMPFGPSSHRRSAFSARNRPPHTKGS